MAQLVSSWGPEWGAGMAQLVVSLWGQNGSVGGEFMGAGIAQLVSLWGPEWGARMAQW